MEKIYFTNSKGDKLCGMLSAENKYNPILILCHGFTTSKNNHTNQQLEKILNKNKISTFRFDFFGHGESEGKFENITASEGKDDILNAIRFLKNQSFKKIGLFGSSFGGLAAILAAGETKDLSLLALKAPVSDLNTKIKEQKERYPLEEWKNKGYLIHKNSDGKELKLNYSYYEDSEKINTYESAENIKIPTLIVHGDKDTHVPIEQSIKLNKIIKNSKLEIIQEEGHFFKNNFQKMINLTSDFIIKNI